MTSDDQAVVRDNTSHRKLWMPGCMLTDRQTDRHRDLLITILCSVPGME